MKRFLLLSLVLACTPTSVADAENKKNASWLGKQGSPDAIAALGRLADKDENAVAELRTLVKSPIGDAGASALDVYIAAWNAIERKADWGKAMLDQGLGDPASAPSAAKAMKRGAAELGTFLPSLEAALQGGCGAPCGGVIASSNVPGVGPIVERRMKDATTRDAICAGLTSRDASETAAAAFIRVSSTDRDAPSCLDAAAPLAARIDSVLQWLGTSAEPGLLGAAARGDSLPCERVKRAWQSAFHDRPKASFAALSIPLVAAVKRCPKELDTLLASAVVSDPETQALAVSGIDPLGGAIGELHTTCAALPGVGHSPASTLTKSRASDLLAKCR